MFNSHRQLPNRRKHRPVEFIQSSPIQPTVEGLTHICARQPKFNVIFSVFHRVLHQREPETQHCRIGKHTLIMTRSALVVPKTALAGAILEISFARFRTSIAASNKEMALPRPESGRRKFEAGVDIGGSCGRRCGTQAIRKNPSPNGNRRWFHHRVHSHLVRRISVEAAPDQRIRQSGRIQNNSARSSSQL